VWQQDFPSPAADHTKKRIDFNERLLQNKAAFFYGKAYSLAGVGFYANDVLVVYRSIDPNYTTDCGAVPYE
jgi:hypothetical protein